MKKNYYITTTLPYVNAKPHIGFALEIIQADALARYHRLLGQDVVFSTGTDEHGVKIFRKAMEQDQDPQTYCDEYAEKFDALKKSLNLSYTHFIRTTDEHHIKATQVFWMKCFEHGDIYKKNYHVKYCVGCEMEKTDSELVDDRCPIHPNMELELIDEENYFFKFSAYQEKLLTLYDTHPDFVIPVHRLKEIRNFVANGLQDFSISRLKEKMPWGVQVPNDPNHVMYVWFDALVNYISTISWPDDKQMFETNWPGVQMAGKDNLRQQSAMWQAMLLSAGIEPSKQIFIHGFITSNGEKMSKSLGNVIDPFELVETYGCDALRYYMFGAISSYEDGDFSIERFEEFYTAHLVNGIGNLTFRILTMLEKYSDSKIPQSDGTNHTLQFVQTYIDTFTTYDFEASVKLINELVGKLDGLISTEKPWEKIKNGENIGSLLYTLVESLRLIAVMLIPIIPETAHKILEQLGYTKVGNLGDEMVWGKSKIGNEVKKGEILFPRLV